MKACTPTNGVVNRYRLWLLEVIFLLVFSRGVMAADSVDFSGFTWNVRQAALSGPGPCTFSRHNVVADGETLTLWLRPRASDGRWTAAEVSTIERFGYGAYRFDITLDAAEWDPSAVLGLFSYPDPLDGPDGTLETDLEYSAWARRHGPHLTYTLFPPTLQGTPQTRLTGLRFEAGGRYVLQYTRRPGKVRFAAYSYAEQADPLLLSAWTVKSQVPDVSMAAYMNLWLYKGKQPPAEASPLSVTINSFSFTPLDEMGTALREE